MLVIMGVLGSKHSIFRGGLKYEALMHLEVSVSHNTLAVRTKAKLFLLFNLCHVF